MSKIIAPKTAFDLRKVQLLTQERGYDRGQTAARMLADGLDALLEQYGPSRHDEVDADQIWRDEIVAEYVSLLRKTDSEDLATDERKLDLLNEAIRDSLDIPRMRANYEKLLENENLH